MSKGTIILAGAGPGDPELLTIAAAKALAAADVILYDALVSPEVLLMAHAGAQKIAVGKKGHGPSCRQDDINNMMVAFAREGKKVLRLKGGDPLIFSRAGEELAAVQAAGIAVHIIPGITAAQGSAVALGKPLTHREQARRLQFVTGHDHKGELPTDIHWPSLADPAVTTVIYMGKKTLAALAQKVMEHGLPPDTPACAVIEATLPQQRVIEATISTLAGKLAAAAPEGPVTVIIGRVVL